MTYKFIEDFIHELSELGVKKGDALLIHSDLFAFVVAACKEDHISLKDLKSVQDKLFEDLVLQLEDLVGQEGSIAIPVFNWDFCSGVGFNIKTTPSQVGAFGNWIRDNRNEFRRTAHPIYSFMVWGKLSEQMLECTNTESFGLDSPFAILHKACGKYLGLNVTLPHSYTFVHYVGCCLQVPYRYKKEFKAPYTDLEGNTTDKIYSMYVRDLSLNYNLLVKNDFYEKCGALKQIKWKRQSILLMDLAMSYKATCDDFLHNQGRNIVTFDNYTVDYSKGKTHEDHLLDKE